MFFIPNLSRPEMKCPSMTAFLYLVDEIWIPPTKPNVDFNSNKNTSVGSYYPGNIITKKTKKQHSNCPVHNFPF